MQGRTWLAGAAVMVLALGAAQPVLAAAGDGPAATVLVVGPGGSGTACTPAAPCTLQQGQLEARRLAPTMASDIDVVLEDGTYDLAGTFQLTPADSGTNGHTVVYRAAPGAHPVLSGGRPITGWHRQPGTADVWEAPITFDTRQLYIDGQSVPLAQGLPAHTGFVQTRTGFLATSDAMDSWPDPSNVAAVFKGGNGAWTQTSCNVASITGLVITMAEPCWQNLHLKGEGVQELSWVDDPMGGFGGLSPATTPTFFENAYALLTPGHWTIDRAAGALFYMAEPGQDLTAASVVAPALQTLLAATGTLTDPVHDITLAGLQFSYGGWTATDGPDGFAEMQADFRLTGPNASNTEGACQYATPPGTGTCPFASWTRTPANVVLSATHDVTIEGDEFAHLGGAGLDLDYGSQQDRVIGNEFTDISANGIQLGSTNDPLPADVGAGPEEINRGNVITDNYLHDVAKQYLGGVGIWLGYTQHSVITHNQIDDVPYTGISIGWGGWHANVLMPNSDPNDNAGNLIADNLLFHYMTTLGDGGAIYSNGSQATSFPTALHVTGNVAYDGANTDFSIYTDAASQYVIVTGNFVYDQPFDSFASGGCRTVGHIRLSGNYFAQGGPAYPCFLYTDVVSSDEQTVCEDPTPAQAPAGIMASAGLEPAARALIDRGGPSVTMVGPTALGLSGGQVLVSGSGFEPGSVVRFGSALARSVNVLSGNYLLATAPSGTGTVAVTVQTADGTSAVNSGSRLAYQSLVLPCVPYLGGGFSTALIG